MCSYFWKNKFSDLLTQILVALWAVSNQFLILIYVHLYTREVLMGKSSDSIDNLGKL